MILCVEGLAIPLLGIRFGHDKVKLESLIACNVVSGMRR